MPQTVSSLTDFRARSNRLRLEGILKDLDTKLDGVLSFVVDEDIVVERMLARGRADDTEDVIRNRLRVYRDETSPLFDYYKDSIVSVDAIGEVEEVNARALAALGK
ncbi:hypothetical protein GCM10020255_065040 [Rhodococcus baikonurensis]